MAENTPGTDHSAPAAPEPPNPLLVRPTPWQVLAVWLGIGFQSFGGGAATLYLIQQAVVERHRWLTTEEFARFWAICQLAPGVNLIGLTVLIGAHVAGIAGIAASLFGLLLPSVAVTIGITAGYASIQEQPLVQAALRGVVPATIGMGLLLSIKLLRPVVAESRREGRASLAVVVGLLFGAIAIIVVWQPPLIAVLWGGGTISAMATWAFVVRKKAAA